MRLHWSSARQVGGQAVFRKTRPDNNSLAHRTTWLRSDFKIESQCTAEFSAAMNGAIGVNNALALEQCKASGINDLDTMYKTLSVFYTENAVAQLKKMCSISTTGLLTYNNGGLDDIRAGRTALVINTNDGATAEGKLYIRVGNICGTAAHRVVDVKFLFENGSWKLDTIIGK